MNTSNSSKLFDYHLKWLRYKKQSYVKKVTSIEAKIVKIVGTSKGLPALYLEALLMKRQEAHQYVRLYTDCIVRFTAINSRLNKNSRPKRPAISSSTIRK